jgi:protein-S-isoprenylcysteine O-methyltransferase Ste14
MRVVGVILLLSGLFFTLYSFLSDPGQASPSVGWAPWIGILVFITGAVTYFRARNEK